MRILATLLLTFVTVSAVMAQDLKLPALSPNASLKQDFSTSSIEITYSRPSMRGRAIFGDLVPFDAIWRTGANSSTVVTFGEDVVIGGVNVKAGKYALYTKPGRTQWEIIINKGTGNWGTTGYSESDDVVRFSVTPMQLSQPVETFTVSIGDITFSTCNIVLAWERTQVVVPIKANNEQRISESIDKAINNPRIPYQQAATYYFETNQHLDKALLYTDKAIEGNPKAFWLHLMKARIAAKMGNKTVATAAANMAIETSKGTAYEAEYGRQATALIQSLR